ncbi:MAG: hypothetical protein IPK52_11075 [Chloroflexi bacterium]|nr:hypothetical protein [Chloroflexota bacterium]
MTDERDGRHDFDFFFGTWEIHHKRLRERLKGSSSGREFHSATTARPTLGGLGNMDETSMVRETGRVGRMTVRFYNPSTHEWSTTGRTALTGFGPVPMVGKFHDGRGVFYSTGNVRRAAHLRCFIWSNISATTCRGSRRFRSMARATWETNWIMDMTRSSEH